MLKPSGTNAGANVETVSLHFADVRPNTLESQTQQATSKAGIANIESRYNTPKIGCKEPSLNVACRERSHACTGTTIPLALMKAAKTNRKTNTATSKRRNNRSRRFLLR